MSTARFLVLGRGSLGNRISDHLNSKGYYSECIPYRMGLFHQIDDECLYECVIDCMDLSHSKYTGYANIQMLINTTRINAIDNIRFRRYVYISSSNVYLACSGVIDENSSTKCPSECAIDKYLENKLQNERILRCALNNRLVILRPVSLWGHCRPGAVNGFFADLLRARHDNIQLPHRNGDEQIISYMHYDDASSMIVHLLTSRQEIPLTCNITAWQWKSRKSLKGSFLDKDDSGTIGWRVSSLHYNQRELEIDFRMFD